MAFIEQVTDEEATGRAREMLETDRAATGFVQNHVRAFASRPDVYDAWVQLRAAIAGPMDKRRYELATVAAAAEIHSSYCCLVHGKILADQFVDADAVCAVVGGAAETRLDEQEVAVVELARKVAEDASTVTQADIDRLRAAGLGDGEIFEVILAAAMRCFFSKTLDACGIQPDSALRGLDPELREALTVGREIAGV
jgi:uncharacterized peroxidase-related enzyme